MANYDLTYEGSRVQNILDTGDELRDAGYIFRGEATPSTVPGTPTERVAYIGGPGTYTNFGSSTVVPSGSIGVFKYTGSAWSNQVIACTVPISTSVQNNDTTVPTGKAVKTAVDAVSGAVGAEATARADADTALGTRIDNEATARGNADTALQNAINTINTKLAEGYVYVGIATSTTNPGTPTGKVFYIATAAGTYTNFGNIVVTQGINILKYNGSTWLLDSFLGIDDAPTQGSASLVKSGGVLGSIIQNGPAFDLSAYNAQGGALATYADLSAALTALNALPADFKKGGMSMKFVLSSDNKYVQYRLMADEFTTDTTQWAIAEDGVYVENPEFVYVKTDAEGKILWAIKVDGSIYYGAGVPQQVVNYINEKIAELSLDEYENIVAFLNGLEEGDKTLQTLLNEKVDKEEDKSLIPTQYIQEVENPEFVDVKIDSDGKIIEATKKDGGKLFSGDVEVRGEMSAEEVSAENILLNGKKLSTTATVDVNSIIEDPEGRLKIETDEEDKIISYRKPDGTCVENVGIETNHLTLTEEGMTDFQQALKDSGFQPGGGGDFTDKNSMYIPEPRLAHLNIITNFDLTTLTKTSDVHVIVEFYDGAGNYFKKYGILNGQGRTSLLFTKKGLGADFFNEDPNSPDFDEDNVFTMKFGDWVPQDSFHIKSYYTDWPRCTTPVVYKLTDEVVRTRGVMNDRPYKKYYVGEYSDAANANTQSDLDKNMETGARCFPDGFPVIVYQNGEFWGVNAWQLKKHRDNYQQSKKKATNIHLDGDMGSHNGSTPFWLWNGTIDWSIYCSGTYGIETRNPKNLYCVDGKKYDADTHDAEIIDTATAEEWIAAGKIIPTDKPIDDTLAGYLRTTGKVRASIEELTTYVPTINQMISDGATAEEIRATIEDMFDVNSFIDYIVIGNVCGNNDAWDNNGQIVTWGKLEGSDRLNWSVNMYDCDITFGCRWDGISASAANNNKLGSTYPLYKIFWDYYYDELKARYHELRDKGIFDADHITQLFRSWMDRVGYDNYAKEFKKWPESPCFRDGSKTYTQTPTTGGFYGSIERIYLWIKKRIQYMDAANFFDYNQN